MKKTLPGHQADNYIRDKGACAISEALKTNTTLVTLNLVGQRHIIDANNGCCGNQATKEQTTALEMKG